MLLICTGMFWDILGCLAALRKIVKVSDPCLSLQKESDVPQMCFSCSALTMICLWHCLGAESVGGSIRE